MVTVRLFPGWWLLSGLGHVIVGAFFNETNQALPVVMNQPLDTNANIGNLKHGANPEDSLRTEHHLKADGSFESAQTQGNLAQSAQIKAPVIEEKIVKITEKIYLEPPTASEIAKFLSQDQLSQIGDAIKSSIHLDEQIDTDALVAKIVASPNMQKLINNYNSYINVEKGDETTIKYENELKYQQDLISNLQGEIGKLRREIQEIEKARNSETLNLITQLRTENAQSNAKLNYQIKRCCRGSFIQIENYVGKILKDLFSFPGEYRANQNDVSNWLHSIFVAKRDLEEHLSNLTKSLREDFNGVIENNGKALMDEIAGKITLEMNRNLHKLQRETKESSMVLDTASDEHIRSIVEEVLSVYDADKTGLVDYAMEPSGGQILSTRCTENYHAGTAVVSILGIPLWYPTNTPRTIITPGVNPGECWAFQNFPGFVIIKLSGPIQIEAFSYEHISRMLVPGGKTDSAPKEFQVLGMKNESDKEPVLLGEYVYDNNGKPLQYFAAEKYGLTFNIIELRILSNHGNPNYTCLYRFRVHGKLNAGPT